MSILESTVNNIDSLNKTSIEQAKKRLDRLIKPQGSLGKMEDICMQLAGIHKSKYFDTSSYSNTFVEKISGDTVAVVYNDMKHVDTDGKNHKAGFVGLITVKRV